MWFVQQLNSFLNLGECKEYPIMPRSKSIWGSKTSRTTETNEQTVTDKGVSSPELNTVAGQAMPAESKPEAKVPSEAKGIATARVAPDRKLEVVKGEARKNLVPINLDDEIRKRAFELYQQRGTGPGSEAEDWLNAEREVRQRYRHRSA
jgi:hypothetical protein